MNPRASSLLNAGLLQKKKRRDKSRGVLAAAVHMEFVTPLGLCPCRAGHWTQGLFNLAV